MGEHLTQAHERLSIETAGRGFVDLTQRIRRWVREISAAEGLVTVFVRHTSASLVIQENADSDVREDLLDTLDLLAPADRNYRHTVEGPDDMPAHIKAMLTTTSLGIPVIDGALLLGTWQAVYLLEHRARPHCREVVLHFVGTVGR
jgi:secondary thiamine-phosphate synthase enzyme